MRLEVIGGFDESFYYQHDTDYCFKIQLRGVELHFVRDAILHYRCRNTLVGIFHQARHWAEESVLLSKYYQSFENGERRPWREFINEWKNLLFSLPQTRHKVERGIWAWRLGWQMGTLIGVMKHLVPPV